MNITCYHIENRRFDSFLDSHQNPVQKDLRTRHPIFEYYLTDFDSSKRRKARKVFFTMSPTDREDLEIELAEMMVATSYYIREEISEDIWALHIKEILFGSRLPRSAPKTRKFIRRPVDSNCPPTDRLSRYVEQKV